MGKTTPYTLTPPQHQVTQMGLLDSGFNCVLQMATGSGKTWLAEKSIEKVLRAGYRAIYVCPTRALAAELYERWISRLPDVPVGVFTGDFGKADAPYPVSFADARLLLMTPERLDSCTRHWRTHWTWIPEVDAIVVDEFHLIGDGYRGARLEGALMRMRRLNPFMRVIALSATLGNRNELADWLNGIEYFDDWRPVPLTWRYVRFKRAEEKPDLLLDEVHRTTQNGGKSLVFAQSRRRAEDLATRLRSKGLRATHHHAGLGYDARRSVEARFRGSDIDVLVTTSTLEVGLNLPVRQVVLYDLQQFDGTDFRPLPRTNVWQRVGRAGRFGLDMEGEAVLFTPSWASKCPDYERGTFEPCRSSLGQSRILAEQIIAELSSGLSRTRSELKHALNESLAAAQGRLGNVPTLLDEMIKSGLLVEQDRSEEDEKEVRLKPTKLGRIASRHMLSPKTVLVFRELLTRCSKPTFFDLLLVACASDDCDPIIPVSFEELTSISDQLAGETSELLNQDPHSLPDLCEISPRRFLAAIKMAIAVRGYTRSGECEDVADGLDCYPVEIKRVCESVARLLPAMGSICDQMTSVSDNPEVILLPSNVPKIIHLLHQMVETGLDEEKISLTLVPGIGPTWAKRLVDAGMMHIEDLAQSDEEDVIALGGISTGRAKQWIDKASELMTSDEIYLLRDLGTRISQQQRNWPSWIDPYRLRRARSLVVTRSNERTFVVTGGSDPHQVIWEDTDLCCDCMDYVKGHRCKHVLAVQSGLGDERIIQAEAQMSNSDKSSSIDLFKLWMS
jgi:helicase